MEQTDTSKVEIKIYKIVSYVLILGGIFLRLDKYFMGRSFRGDEVALALDVIHRSIFDLLTKPLDNQVAPMGFLVLTKLLISVLGNSDYVFRLLPLIAGCASVVLVYVLSKKITGIHGTIFVLAGFVLNSSLIIYSSDFKQYSSDVLIAVLLYLCAANYLQSPTKQSLYILGVVGLLAILCSHPAIFIAGSISLLLLVFHRKDKQKLVWIVILSSIWAGLFISLYFVFFRPIGNNASLNSTLLEHWDSVNALMPIPPWEDLSWYPTRIGGLFTTLLGLPPFAWFEAFIFLIGLGSFYLQKRWEWIIAFTAPIILTMLASGAINYPFKGRLIFFLIPGLLIVLGEGLQRIFQLLIRNKWLAYAVWLPLLLFLLSTPLQSANTILTSARSYPFDEDIKPVLEYIRENGQPGDLIYLYYGGRATFDYYRSLYGLIGQNIIYGQDTQKTPQNFSKEFDTFPKDRRIWFIFSHVQTKHGMDERIFITDYIEKSGGQLLDEYDAGAVSFGYLYMLK